jgi:hypothetical protein
MPSSSPSGVSAASSVGTVTAVAYYTANTLVQSNSGGYGSGTVSATASPSGFNDTTQEGSLLLLVVWLTAVKTGADNAYTINLPTTTGFTWVLGKAAYSDVYDGTHTTIHAVAIFYIKNAASMADTLSTVVSGASSSALATTVECSLFEIVIGGGGIIDTSCATDNGSGTPTAGTLDTTATDVVFVAVATAGTSTSAGPGYTQGIGAEVYSLGTTQYVLNDPAGSIPTLFTSGSSETYGAAAIAFSVNPVLATPLGVSSTSAIGTETTDVQASVFPLGVRASGAVGIVSVPQPGPGLGSFEVRLSDDSWGCDDGGNLIGRYTSQKFSIPRIKRNKTIFIKEQDGRNNILSSEIWVNGGGSTQYQSGIWTNTVDWTLIQALDPDYNLKLVNSKVMVPGDSTSQTTQAYLPLFPNISYSATLDIKGPSGNWVTLGLVPNPSGDGLSASYASYQLTGQWQRITVSAKATSGASTLNTLALTFSLTPGVGGMHGVPASYTFPVGGITVYGTRASLEEAAAETIYCKTKSNGSALTALTPYGALSRYAASINCGYPFPPQPPTGFVDISDFFNPIVNVILPSVAQDVWGVEIRAQDNTTVLYHDYLTDASYAPTYTVENNTNLSLLFYLYTYNLLGEYSTPYTLSISTLASSTAYSSTQTYAAGTVVTYEGATYVSLIVTMGNVPTNTTYWQLLAGTPEPPSVGQVGAGTLGWSELTVDGFELEDGSGLFLLEDGISYLTLETAVVPATYILLPVPSVEEISMPMLQTGASVPTAGGFVTNPAATPGNTLTVFYNDVHDRSGPDTSIINAFLSPAGAFVYLSGGTLPAIYQGIFQVIGYGYCRPPDGGEDTHNFFQVTVGGPPAYVMAEFGDAKYQQALFV